MRDTNTSNHDMLAAADAAFEMKYQRDARDPAQQERLSVWREAWISASSRNAPDATTVPAELSVTKILLRVAPGKDGMGEEIYAKSVRDVQQLLSEMGEKIETLQSEKQTLQGEVSVSKTLLQEAVVTLRESGIGSSLGARIDDFLQIEVTL